MKGTYLNYFLLTICLCVWVVTAINPYDFEAWALEQIASALCVGLFLWSRRYVSYSPVALLGLATLFLLHATGTHYTYSLTPYDPALKSLTGLSLNELFGWERNHYDRFVHLYFGFAAARVFYEYLDQSLIRPTWSEWLLSFNLVVSLSAIYELMEWAAVIIFASESGMLYLGTQGDIWDAQADIALGGLGAVLAWFCFSGPVLAKHLLKLPRAA